MPMWVRECEIVSFAQTKATTGLLTQIFSTKSNGGVMGLKGALTTRRNVAFRHVVSQALLCWLNYRRNKDDHTRYGRY